MFFKRNLIFLFFLIITNFINAQYPLNTVDSAFQKKWVDSIYNSMTLKEKIGQLFMVQVFSDESKLDKSKVISLIKNQKIGGLIYSSGGPVRQAILNNELQSVSKLPLLIGMDAEWGLNMRLDSTFAFPWNMTLGAISDLGLIRKTGKHIGEHCKRLGVHFNFSPVVDINTNPNNPIIGNRSFGEDKINVTNKSLALMKGMQSTGILACAKHFPGHGDTDKDSHKTLPTISFNKKRLYNVEFFPYETLIRHGLSSVMVAHLNVPALDSRTNYPSSLSEKIITNNLKSKLNFKGLIFTDALDMNGVSNFSSPGDVDLNAFLAGNDILLMSKDVISGINKIELAYNQGRINESRLSHSVKKILYAKFKVGLNNYTPIEISNIISDVNRVEDRLLNFDLIKKSQTVIKNDNNILPLKNLDLRKIAYVPIGDSDGNYFFETLKKYTKVQIVKNQGNSNVFQELEPFNTIIVGFHKSNDNPWKSYKFSKSDLDFLDKISRNKKIILTLFSSPYSLNQIKNLSNIESVLVAYQNSKISQEIAGQIIFGAISSSGKLPVSIMKSGFSCGDGIQTQSINRLSYGLPESVGVSGYKLNKLDSIAKYAIETKMTPGIQLLVARKGKVIYNKTFGFHTYKNINSVNYDHIFDLASLTKILVSLPLLMELIDRDVISLNDKLENLLPNYKNSNKASITLKEMLSHYAQLTPWIPFYKSTLDSITENKNPKFFSEKKSIGFPIQISDNNFLRNDFKDTIRNRVLKSELLKNREYRYSDLPYYIIKELIELHYNESLDILIKNHFFNKIGANYSTYLPLNYYDKETILPTEEDDYFRFEKVHGYVHDMGAAMQSGIGGHAGLFSNANDIAKIMQMYLQKGSYGDYQFIESSTFDAFNKCYYCNDENRRGVGFDKPQLEEDGPTCGCVSMSSFGHTGFTGTMAWADPEDEIIYVFLSNRTYPDSSNNSLLDNNIRTEVQRFVHESIIDR